MSRLRNIVKDTIATALAQEIGTLHHVGIAAPDLPSICTVYCDLLGFQLQEELDFPSQQVHVALLQKGSDWLEILVPSAPDSVVGRFLAKRGPGLHHLCYTVQDLERTLARLQELEVQLVHAQAAEGVWGPVLFIHPKFAHGVMIELLELRQP